MIPIHLRLTGFLSYRDPVELDFTGFDLACISGANGAGKSSLLDAMTWALFGQARKRDDSVINTHCTAAEVNLVFKYEGNLYRVQRTKPRDKPTILEFFLSQDGQAGSGVAAGAGSGGDAARGPAWKPLTERSVRETEASIQNTLRMDYDTFINASFFLQGKADQFATQRPSDRKRILSSILGLEVWETYRENAAGRRRTLETECHGIDGRLQEIQAELAEETARKEKLGGLEASLETLSQKRQAQETALESMRRLADSLAQQRRLVETYAQEWKQAQQGLGVLENRLRLRQEECDAFRRQLERAQQIEAAYHGWHQVRQDLERWEDVAARFRAQEKTRSEPLIEIEGARAQLEHEKQGLVTMRALLEAALAQVPRLQEESAVIERTIQELNQRLERRAEVEQAIRVLHKDLAEARAENPRLKAEMDELKSRIDQLEHGEPATGDGPAGSTCPLCGQPLSLHERKALIAHLKTEGRSLGDRYRENLALLKDFDNRLRSLEKELQSLLTAEPQIRDQGRQLDQVNHKRQQIAQGEADWLAQGAPRLQSLTHLLETNAFAPEAQSRLAKIDAELKAFGYDAAAHDAVRRAEMEGRSSEIEYRNLETARAALNPLEREIADLDTQVTANRDDVERRQAVYEQARQEYDRVASQAPDVDRAELELLATREQENRLRLEVGAARQKVLVLDDLRRRQTGLNAQRDSLTRQISLHKSLERAFSKDGVPALLIEQAMPEIENQANEILQRLSGGSMTVSFVTQREYKDKKRDDLKETLDIQISDAAGMRDYEMFSGGEAFRVNFAIRLALSRVLAQRAGARLQTLVIDEGFGSQDEQGRQRLIEAINLVHGDFSKILVITHLEELKDAFPNRIEVEKTGRGSEVRVV
jgi:exonuclease SbcC